MFIKKQFVLKNKKEINKNQEIDVLNVSVKH